MTLPVESRYTPPCGFSVLGVSVSQAFWDRVRLVPDTGCWEWTGPRNACGYGTTNVENRSALAHRVAWELLRGPIPDGLLVCHKCDNPPCCNPDHLFLGTQADNMQDAARKGRIPGKRTLTEEDAQSVREALHTDESTRDIAARFGVRVGAIINLAQARSWRHQIGAVPVVRSELSQRINKAKKLTSEEAVEIRKRVAAGEAQRVVGEAFGVNQSVVSRIVNRVRRAGDGGPSAPVVNNWRRLTPQQAKAAYDRVAAGESHESVAQTLGLSREAISSIAQGKAYAAVTGGEPIRRFRLSVEQQAEIVARLAQGELQRVLASEFGVTQTTISHIKQRAARGNP